MELLVSRRFAAMTSLAAVGRMQNTMSVVALVGAGTAAGLSPVQTSVLGGSLFAAAAISALWKGKALDQMGYGIVRFQAIAIGVCFAFIAASLLFLPWWVALAGVIGLGGIRLNPGTMQQSLWSSIHEGTLLQRALAMENLLGFLAQTAGPLLAALCIYLVGGIFSLLVTGALASGSMILWSALAPDGSRSAKTKHSKASPLGILWPVAVSLFLLSTLAGLNQGLLLQGGIGALGIALFALGAGAASLYYLRKGLPFGEHWRSVLAATPLVFALLFAGFNSAFVYVLLPIAGIAFSSAALAANAQIRSLVPRDKLNESFSLVLLGNTLGVSAGIFFSGVIISLLPIFWPPVAVGSIVVSLLVWMCLGAMGMGKTSLWGAVRGSAKRAPLAAR